MEQRKSALPAQMRELGCSREAVREAERLIRAGTPEELIRCLRRCRCELMEDLHECQKRVDHLDVLIRGAEQERTGQKT